MSVRTTSLSMDVAQLITRLTIPDVRAAEGLYDSPPTFIFHYDINNALLIMEVAFDNFNVGNGSKAFDLLV